MKWHTPEFVTQKSDRRQNSPFAPWFDCVHLLNLVPDLFSGTTKRVFACPVGRVERFFLKYLSFFHLSNFCKKFEGVWGLAWSKWQHSNYHFAGHLLTLSSAPTRARERYFLGRVTVTFPTTDEARTAATRTDVFVNGNRVRVIWRGMLWYASAWNFGKTTYKFSPIGSAHLFVSRILLNVISREKVIIVTYLGGDVDSWRLWVISLWISVTSHVSSCAFSGLLWRPRGV